MHIWSEYKKGLMGFRIASNMRAIKHMEKSGLCLTAAVGLPDMEVL